MSLSCIYQDDDLLVVSKPSGLLCVPGLASDDNLFDRVRRIHPNSRVVHRLDMGTSGLVIFAQNHLAQKNLGRHFEHKRVRKVYYAEVLGHPRESAGEIHSPMLCDWPNRPKHKIDWIDGKLGSTYYRVVARYRQSSLVELIPHSGRTHQLRLHMLQLGNPILGDALYGTESLAPRLQLHAYSLQFPHPNSGLTLMIKSLQESWLTQV